MGSGNRVKGSRPKPKSIKAKNVNLSSKRRLSRFGKIQQKGKSGFAAHYVSRAKALKTLQITLRDFRRLCILKGIYPRDPKKKPNKDKNKTYYHVKDISYLAHEPLLDNFREFKAFMKKVRKRIAKKEHGDAIKMYDQKPEYTLHHLVRERYPTFQDSLHDMDDALCLVHLFAALPSQGSIRVERTEKCLSLAKEWQFYVAKSKSLRKVFCSVKGMYYQARVHGVDVTWLVPHKFAQNLPNDVDYRVMLTFLEFYQTSLAFVMYKLYHNLGLRYPPHVLQLSENQGAHLAALTVKPSASKAKSSPPEQQNNQERPAKPNKPAAQPSPAQDKATKERLASLQAKLPMIEAKSVEVEEEETKEEKEGSENVLVKEAGKAASEALATPGSLFAGMVFFVSREVPYETMELCLLSFGATIESKDPESDRITYHITDRKLHKTHASRDYVQPQWVFDCINASMLLPISRYHPDSKDLPPHLSPFVDDAAEGYTPLYAEEIKRLRAARNANSTAPALIADNKSGLESLLERKNERADSSDSEESTKDSPSVPVESESDDAESDDAESEEVEESKEQESKEPKAPAFLSSATFQGAKPGYVFRSGTRGVGYYTDTNAQRRVTFRPSKGLSKRAQRNKNKAEAHKRGEMMMSKKAKRLYGRMQHGIKKKRDQVDLLKRKRAQAAGSKSKKKRA